MPIYNIPVEKDKAKMIKFDNTESQLQATNVQDAVDEINTNLVNENNETFRYAYQNGERGVWVKEAGTDVFIPFSRLTREIVTGTWFGNNSVTIPTTKKAKGFVVTLMAGANVIPTYVYNEITNVVEFYSSATKQTEYPCEIRDNEIFINASRSSSNQTYMAIIYE